MPLILWTEERDVSVTGHSGTVRIVRLKPGRADEDLGVLMRELSLQSRTETPRLVLTVGDADLTSDVIGTLVAAWEHHRLCGGEMVVCELNSRASGVFDLCRLDKLFRIFDHERDAIAHLQQDEAGEAAVMPPD